MTEYTVEHVACGSAVHLSDIETLRQRGFAIPHDYAAWPLHSTTGSWIWCRAIEPSGRVLTGVATHLSSSRSIPGFRIGRVDRIGRALHEEAADSMGAILSRLANTIPRLLRLDARVFDEDAPRRQRLADSLKAAGWSHCRERSEYTQTLVLRLEGTNMEVAQKFSKRVRNNIDRVLASPSLRFEPVKGAQYAARIRELQELTFARTGSQAPPLDVQGILADSASGETSFLIGAFANDGKAPDDLVAFAWARLHGDHAVLVVNASERSQLFRHLSPGFGLIYRMIGWAIERGATWFDLGGLSSMEPAEDNRLRGIIQFKKRFSTNLCEVADEWRFEPRPLLSALSSTIHKLARIAPHEPTL